MLLKSLPCGAKTSWQARALGLASSLLPLFLLVSVAQAQTGYHILSVPGSTYEVFRHMAVDGNGKIYIAATCGRTDGGFSVIAVLPTGSLDPAWGTGGVVSTRLTDYGAEARGIAIQPDGRIVVTGNANRKSRGNLYVKDLAVVRYNPDGTLDRTFNYVPASKKGGTPEKYGMVITDFGGEENGENVIFQSDGKIVVGGARDWPRYGTYGDARLATFRYNSNGTLDTTYGIGGKAEASFGTGYSFSSFNPPDDLAFHMGGILYGLPLGEVGVGECLGLMRFQGNGLGLDWTFGNGGTVTYPIPNTADHFFRRFAIDSIGRIVTVAYTGLVVDGSNFVVFRFNSDGSLDPSLGEGRGYRGTEFVGEYTPTSNNYQERLGDIALDANGKGVILDNLRDALGPAFVGRFEVESGKLDTSFGGTGVVVLPDCETSAYPGQMAIAPDGRIVVAVVRGYGSARKIFLARLLPDGTFDPNF